MPAKIIKCQSVFPQGSWAHIKMIQKFLTEFVGAFGFGWHMVHVFMWGVGRITRRAKVMVRHRANLLSLVHERVITPETYLALRLCDLAQGIFARGRRQKVRA